MSNEIGGAPAAHSDETAGTVPSTHQGLLTNRPRQGFPGHLFGQFIWDRAGSDRFLVLRRRFSCHRPPERALLHIAAAHKYRLFVNGESVGRGPCRSVHNGWTRYDTHDITARLRAGLNGIAVLAFYHGGPTYFSCQPFGGVFVQAELFDGDTCRVVASDETWRVRRPERYRRDTRIMNYYSAIPAEFVEADKDAGDWIQADFDDSEWENAAVRLAGPVYASQATAFVQCLEPRPTPQLRERALSPVAIVRTGEQDPATAVRFGELDIAQRLWHGVCGPLERASIAGAERLLDERGAGAELTSHAAPDGTVRDPFLILDFGRPVIGMPEIVIEAPAGTVVEIGYAEKLVDGRVPFYDVPDEARHSWNDWLHADRYVAGEGVQTWRLFEPRTATRYLHVVFRTGGKPARLRAARLIAQEYPVEERGRFECSDPTLNTLWRAAVDTVYLAMEDVLSCDSVRERSYYFLAGELEQHHQTIYAAYGDDVITEAHFQDTVRHQEADGTFAPVMITRGNHIKNYALFCTLAILRRHRYFGKAGFLEAQYPAIVRTLDWFARQTDADGLPYNLPHSVWTDWTAIEPRGANLETNALYVQALTDAADIAGQLGRHNDAEQWLARAEKARDAIRRQHWDDERGWFRDSVVDGRQAPEVTETSNAMTLLFGVADERQAARVIEHLVAWSQRPQRPDARCGAGTRAKATTLEDGSRISRVSPLYLYYVLNALLRVGRETEAWAYLANRYGPVFAGSGPHFLPETWIVEGEQASVHSSASIHGGGAGVALLLFDSLLGIRPLAPGFGRCRIEPRPGALAWARGVFPSARGDIAVNWKRAAGSFDLEVNLPAGMETELAIPLPDGQTSVTHNGRILDAVEQSVGGRATITVCGGTHRISIDTVE